MIFSSEIILFDCPSIVVFFSIFPIFTQMSCFSSTNWFPIFFSYWLICCLSRYASHFSSESKEIPIPDLFYLKIDFSWICFNGNVIVYLKHVCYLYRHFLTIFPILIFSRCQLLLFLKCSYQHPQYLYFEKATFDWFHEQITQKITDFVKNHFFEFH